ncbi:MAG: 3-deoxy-D-manno-octulosonic acid transferase [Candidatus Omnitrophica bacterium]|nr:3-deoxy-D-manno-octulosonic acid transferase [Candidatus Omnitrophota bacterium]
MLVLYNFILLFYALLYLPYLLLTGRGYTGFSMRTGRFDPEIERQIKQNTNIWLHGVSVGEVMVIDNFLSRLRQLYPAYQFVVTVTTKTGYALACERLRGKALVVPSPVDFSWVTSRFVKLIAPKLYIAVETEIWPNLFRRLHLKNIPAVVINGRISDASFSRYKWVRLLLRNVLNQIRVWCMQSKTDADRVIDLGAEASKVVVVGNIKFDEPVKPAQSSVWSWEQGRNWWVAGSTHPGEEDMVLDAYIKLIEHYPQWRLIIAPRHVERTDKIMQLIAGRAMKSVKFSQWDKKALARDTVVIVDTIGQLRSLYSVASLVFVGKSLVKGGGQNIIEPASYGKAVIIGPHVQNFRDIVACFKEREALVQVADPESFEKAVLSLGADEERRRALGDAAKEVVAVNQGATERCLEYLAGFLQ